MQLGMPWHTQIFDKIDIINIITNTYSHSIKAVDTRYRNTIYSTGIPLLFFFFLNQKFILRCSVAVRMLGTQRYKALLPTSRCY